MSSKKYTQVLIMKWILSFLDENSLLTIKRTLFISSEGICQLSVWSYSYCEHQEWRHEFGWSSNEDSITYSSRNGLGLKGWIDSPFTYVCTRKELYKIMYHMYSVDQWVHTEDPLFYSKKKKKVSYILYLQTLF